MISCVIIAKNEEKNIARCLESVLKETQDLAGREIILVDSCSQDKTVEIAQRYPINIISLRPTWPLSPSAGRFSGINNTSAEFILCIDADMQLQQGWLNTALAFLKKTPNAAAVQGRHYDIYYLGDTLSRPSPVIFTHHGDQIKKITSCTQSFVLRRQYVLSAGNTHPYLRAGEESELSYRLRKQGYDLYYLPHDAVYHYRIPVHTLQETKRRVSNNLYAGLGDLESWCIYKGYYSMLARFVKFYLLIGFVIATVSLISYGLAINNFIVSIIGLLIPAAFVFLQMLRKKSVYFGFVSVANNVLISLNLIGGLFRKINEISDYPKDVIWIKRI